ncbi:MAG: hypothetical protein VR68_11585 [Peptococcaceae bacterium BRH_c4a]|nr:MAG: hypothetical protein VR68_11585 [Peptococcaceae bacterium BRH_c4a]
MLITKAYENPTNYLFIITDDTQEDTFEYMWGKTPPEGQTLEQYLQNCKRESELLAQYEIDRKAPPKEIQL